MPARTTGVHHTRYPELLSLEIPHLASITDGGVFAIARGCRKLRYLDAGSCCHVTEAVLVALGESCVALEELRIDGMSLSDVGMYGNFDVVSGNLRRIYQLYSTPHALGTVFSWRPC